MPTSRRLPVTARCRVIVDNDWAGDPDGLVALAHHLLSPANRVVAVTSSFLSPVFGDVGASADRGAAMARELVDLIGPAGAPAVHAGCEAGRSSCEAGPSSGACRSAASEAMVTEALREDPLPLYLVCGGPLTNVAAALEQAPDIASRMTVVWVGGALTASTFEYNRDTDPVAVERVFASPDVSIWQFPLETYRRCAYSVAELEHDLAGSGEVGAWLWQRYVELPLPEWIQLEGVWPLGDSPPVLVTALNDNSSAYTETPAAAGSGSRRVYTDIDSRLLVGDMLARLRLHRTEGAAAS